MAEFIQPAGICLYMNAILLQCIPFRENGILKASVSDHFGIEASVSRPVDILEKNTVKILRRLKSLLSCFYLQLTHQ